MRRLWMPLLAVAVLAACQPLQQERSPQAKQAKLEQEAALLPDGARVPLASWLPEGEPDAVVLALHGFNDYRHAFEPAGAFLRQHGIALYAYDQRGFGAAPKPGIWAGQDNLVHDMRSVARLLKARYGDAPLYLLGESMGGAVVLAGCTQAPGCPMAEGVVLVAPAVWGEDSFSGFYRFLLWLLAHTAPGSEWTGEDLDIQATDNLELLYAMARDPLIIKQTRVDALYGLVGLMDAALRNVEKLQKPTLLLYGAKDEVIPLLPVARAIRRLEAPLSVAYYPEGYHMLLRDLQREVVLRDIVSWIDNRYHPLPSGADMGWKEELLGIEE